MKAVQITEPGKARLVDIEKPQLQPGMVMLRVAYVGFCGSDLNTFRGLNPLVRMPIIPGHEIGAVIDSVGADVPAEYKPGLKVTVNPYTACGHCPACRGGRPNACRDNETLGVQRNGAMAEYVVLPYGKVIIEDSLSTRQLALVEPMCIGFHAVNRGKAAKGEFVMVTGCGMIGLGAIVGASQRGARVIAVDVDDEKLALAQRLGAEFTVNSMTQDLHACIQEITGGDGADLAIEAVGRPQTYLSSLDETSFTGRVVYIGYAKEKVAYDTQYFVKKEIDIRGSRNAMPEDFAAVIAYLKSGKCPMESLISKIYEPEQAQEALEYWSANPGKVFRIMVKLSEE